MIQTARDFLRKHPSTEWFIPSVFCLIMLAQVLLSVQQMSQQADEAIHLYAGYRALKCGDFDIDREHPPLARMLVAIPLLVSNAPLDCRQQGPGIDETDQATRWLYAQDAWWRLLMEARVASSLFSVALCLGVWIAARRMFGRTVAVVSTAILVFEPNILGHGALLLNNVLLSALFLFTVFSFYLWTGQRSPLRLVVTGVFTGMALLTKHSAVLLIPTLYLLAVLEAWLESAQTESIRRTLRNLGAVTAILVIATATIWCGFGLHYSGIPRRGSDAESQDQVARMDSAELRILKSVRAAHLMPQPYLDGLIDARNLVGTSSDVGVMCILGKSYEATPWFFFPLSMSIKFTVAFLLMLAMGGTGIIAFGKERRKEMLFLLVPALLYLAVSMRVQRTAIGFWHLFPMFPFLVIAAAAGCVFLSRRYRWVGVTLVCLLVLNAVSSLRAYPNYLSYANELWGGPQNLYKRLPWTDVDQTLWQVSRYMKEHPNTPCWVASSWYVPVASYKVPCIQMGKAWMGDVPGRMRGIVFVSSSWLEIEGQPGGSLASFYTAEPKARLGGSAMLVYEGEFDTSVAAARVLDNKALLLITAGNRAEALPVAKRAAELTPSSYNAHYWYGVALAYNRQPEEGISEFLIARKLALAEAKNLEAGSITRDMKSIARQFDLPLPPEVE